MDWQTEGGTVETIVSSGPVQEMSQKGNGVQNGVTDDGSSENQGDADRSSNSEEDGSDVQNRPLSPGTRALMWDEEDAMFMAAGSLKVSADQSQNITQKSSTGHECTDVYAEQEKLVLTRFRDFLSQLITYGSIKETMWSPFSINKESNRQEPAENGAVKSGIPVGWQNEPYSKGIVKSQIPATVEIG